MLDLVSVTLETEWEHNFGLHYTVTVLMGNRRNVAELKITECDPSDEFTHRASLHPVHDLPIHSHVSANKSVGMQKH